MPYDLHTVLRAKDWDEVTPEQRGWDAGRFIQLCRCVAPGPSGMGGCRCIRRAGKMLPWSRSASVGRLATR